MYKDWRSGVADKFVPFGPLCAHVNDPGNTMSLGNVSFVFRSRQTGGAHCVLAFCGLLAGLWGPAGAHAEERLSTDGGGWSAPVNGLRMGVFAAKGLRTQQGSFKVRVIFNNINKEPLLVLPEFIAMHYEALGKGKASYTPYPGPPTNPYRDVRQVAPGKIEVIAVAGLRDTRGMWRLEPGSYRLTVRYAVPGNLIESAAPRPANLPPGRIWAGTLDSVPVVANVER